MAVTRFVPVYARTRFGTSPVLVGGILAGGKLTKSLTQSVVGGYTDRLGHGHLFVFVGAVLYALGAASIPFVEYAVDWFAPTPLALGSLSTTLPPAFLPLFGVFAVCGIADSIRLPASMALFVEEGTLRRRCGEPLAAVDRLEGRTGRGPRANVTRSR